MTVPVDRTYDARDLAYPMSIREFLCLPLRPMNTAETFDELPREVLAHGSDAVYLIEDPQGARQRLVLKDGKLWRQDIGNLREAVLHGLEERYRQKRAIIRP